MEKNKNSNLYLPEYKFELLLLEHVQLVLFSVVCCV